MSLERRLAAIGCLTTVLLALPTFWFYYLSSKSSLIAIQSQTLASGMTQIKSDRKNLLSSGVDEGALAAFDAADVREQGFVTTASGIESLLWVKKSEPGLYEIRSAQTGISAWASSNLARTIVFTLLLGVFLGAVIFASTKAALKPGGVRRDHATDGPQRRR